MVESLANSSDEFSIDVLVRKGNESLLDNNPHISNTLVWNKKEGKYSNLRKLLSQIRKERYDAVVNLQRFGASGFLTAFSGAPIRVLHLRNSRRRRNA